MEIEDNIRAPGHLWFVAIISLFWNAFGAFDYVMTKTGNATYLANFTAEQLAYFKDFPTGLTLFWALGVWGALAGSLLLLVRSRFAVTAFGLSLLGLLGSTIWQFGFMTMPDSLKTGGIMLMNLVIWAVAIGLFLYSRNLLRQRVLH